MAKVSALFLILIALLFSGCGLSGKGIKLYRLETYQGNMLDEEKVVQIRAGQTKKQIRFLLGTPLIVDTFHNERWDYFYYSRIRDSYKKPKISRLTIFFNGDTAEKIQRLVPSTYISLDQALQSLEDESSKNYDNTGDINWEEVIDIIKNDDPDKIKSIDNSYRNEEEELKSKKTLDQIILETDLGL
jgi:outer membrane protein assembly factor BamE